MAFFSCLEMCMGCCARVLATRSAEKPLWGVAGLLQVRHSPFQMAPMAPPQGMAEPRSQDSDISGNKESVPTWTILWFYYSNARVQLCNMNIISVMNFNSFRQVEVWIVVSCASHLATISHVSGEKSSAEYSSQVGNTFEGHLWPSLYLSCLQTGIQSRWPQMSY